MLTRLPLIHPVLLVVLGVLGPAGRALGLEGKLLVTKDQNPGDLIIVDAATGDYTTLVEGPICPPVFSPDGTQIAYHDTRRGNVICIMNNDGSNQRDICHGHTPHWNPPGHLMWGTDTEVYRANIATGQVSVVATFGFVGWFSACLDGTRGASTYDDGNPNLQVWKYDLVTGEALSLGNGCQGTISPNGEYITHNLASHTDAVIHNWDGSIHRNITAPAGVRFVTHRFSRTDNDYIVYTAEYTNPAHAYVYHIPSDTHYKIGEMGVPWDFWPGTLPPPGPVAPEITSVAPATAHVSVPYSYQVTVTGQPTPTLSVSGDPAWLTLDAAASTLQGTPGGSDLGASDTITVTATNSGGTDTQQFQIVVTYPVVDDPAAPDITSAAPTTATVGALWSYAIQATGNPTPGYTVIGAPAWLTLSGDVLSGTPDLGSGGVTDTITITAANGVDPVDTESYQLTVTEGATIISVAPKNATEDELYSYTVGTVGYPAPTVTVAGLPAWLTFGGTDTISGTPSISDVGTTDTITITTTNASGTDTEQFEIVVHQAPTITILSPVAGDVWYVGTTPTIEWDAINVNNVVICYSTVEGSPPQLICPSLIEGVATWEAFPFLVPDEPSDECRIHMSGYMGEALTQTGLFEIRIVTDVDLDGMDDGWESAVFGDMEADGAADFDGDGWTDVSEFMHGTDPTDPDDMPPALITAAGGATLSCGASLGFTAQGVAFLAAGIALLWRRRRRGATRPTGC